jgi:hypothetical protein
VFVPSCLSLRLIGRSMRVFSVAQGDTTGFLMAAVAYATRHASNIVRSYNHIL